MQPHFFLALPLAAHVKTELADWARHWQSNYPFASWVVAEDYHITLHFLGAATEQQLQRLSQELKPIVRSIYPFALVINQLGCFGQSQQPRIFWAGLADSPQLAQLQKSMAPSCQAAGFTVDQRPYRPHITIARKWKGKDPFVLPPMPVSPPLSWTAEEVILYRSHHDRLPKYEAIARFRLGE